MITSISIENFKGIGKRVTIPLKPITLLFGPNSAGKSSILQALHYALEVMERHNLDADKTVSGGDFVDLGGFHAFVHGHDLKHPITLAFELQRAGNEILLDAVGQWQAYENEFDEIVARLDKVESCRVEITIAWSTWLKRPFVSRYAVAIDGRPITQIEADVDKKGAKIVGWDFSHPLFDPSATGSEAAETAEHMTTLWHSVMVDLWQNEATRVIALFEQRDALPDFDMDLPIQIPEASLEASRMESGANDTMYLAAINILSRIIAGPGKELRRELKSMRYLGPLRETPPRNYEAPRLLNPSRWASGLAAWDLLPGANAEFITRLNAWLSQETRLDIGYEIRQRRAFLIDDAIRGDLKENEGTEVWWKDFESMRLSGSAPRAFLVDGMGTQLHPQDVGIGISQVLPVVVAILAPGSDFVAVEQPELHVHPRVQVALGDLLIEQAVGKEGDRRRMLIETHSEHMLLRLLRRIRETTEGGLPGGAPPFKRDELAVLYIDKPEDETTILELRVDDNAEFLDKWPGGFFEERGEELFG